MSESLGRKGIALELEHILDVMDVIDESVDVSGAGQLQVDETVTQIPFTLWESLAYDLALGTAPIKQIAAGYDVSVIQVQELITNNHFDQLLTAKKKEVSKLGDGAAFTIAFRMIANKGIESFMSRIASNNTPDKEFLGLFKQAVELAQLKPEPDPEGGTNTPLGGPSVTFNIFGVPGLDHLNTPQSNVIDITEAASKEAATYVDEIDDEDDEDPIVILERW